MSAAPPGPREVISDVTAFDWTLIGVTAGLVLLVLLLLTFPPGGNPPP